jgi:hypothetical protein
MIRKKIIKLFKLYDISGEALKEYVQKATDRQKKLDEKYWTIKIHEELESLKREHKLDLHEKDSEILELEEKLKDFKKRKKGLDIKEAKIKEQARNNLSVAVRISSKAEDLEFALLNTLGEMRGIKDEAETNKQLVEGK